jgi:hypothetical protein
VCVGGVLLVCEDRLWMAPPKGLLLPEMSLGIMMQTKCN